MRLATECGLGVCGVHQHLTRFLTQHPGDEQRDVSLRGVGAFMGQERGWYNSLMPGLSVRSPFS